MRINEVYHGDCLELMRDIDDKSIDMILCDLPYGTTACKWDSVIPFEPLWNHYKRIIKDNGAIVLTASQPFTSALVMSNIKMFKYCWVWYKSQAVGHLNAWRQPTRNTEDIVVFYNKQCLYKPELTDKPIGNIRPVNNRTRTSDNYGYHKLDSHRCPPDKSMPSTVLRFNNSQGRLHPTQKPVPLFEYLIKTYTNEGELVLDNCAGSGTTAIAAMNTNRNYILMEKDEGYFNVAKDRTKSHESKNNS